MKASTSADSAASPTRSAKSAAMPEESMPDGDARAFRADFFKALRASIDPESLPSVDRPPALFRSRPLTFSQPLCAMLMGVGEKTLRNLETGISPWSAQLVERFEKAAGLLERDDQEARDWRTGLWGVALGRRPPGLFPSLNIADRLILSRKRASDPTFVTDDAWNLLGCNRAALRWFPRWRDGANILEYTLGEVGEATLPDWEKGWVGPMCAQVRLTLAFSGVHDAELYRFLTRAMAGLRERSEVVDRQWNVRRYAPGPDGMIRKVTVPVYAPGAETGEEIGRREVTVLLGTSTKMGTVNTRITTLFEPPWDVDEEELFIAPIAADA